VYIATSATLFGPSISSSASRREGGDLTMSASLLHRSEMRAR
jgi:hypothetical protein